MAEYTPTFQGEIQFRRYSDTSTQGQQVVFAVQDREALECFIGKEGKRFMAVLVEVGDDEQPVNANPLMQKNSGTKPELKREPLGDLCWRAVQWCKEPEFWSWMCSMNLMCDSEEGASRFVKSVCGVGSRKDLDTDKEAARKFNQLIRGPYQKHLISRGVVR